MKKKFCTCCNKEIGRKQSHYTSITENAEVYWCEKCYIRNRTNYVDGPWANGAYVECREYAYNDDPELLNNELYQKSYNYLND